MTTEKRKAVEIPESLYDRIAARIDGTEFRTVTDYVMHALRERLAREESEHASGYTREDEEKVKDRLRALGYL